MIEKASQKANLDGNNAEKLAAGEQLRKGLELMIERGDWD